MRGVIFFLTLQEHLLGFLALSYLPVKKKTEKDLLNQEGILGVPMFGRNVLMMIMKGFCVQKVALTNPQLEPWHVPIMAPTVFNNPSPGRALVAHAFYPSTREAEADGSQ